MKHVLKKRELAGLEIVEALYPPNSKQPRHTHALASFSFVLGGSYLENYGAHSATRQPSTIVFRPPRESHAVVYHGEPVRILSVQLDSARLSYLKEHSTVFNETVSRQSETIKWLGHRMYREFYQSDSFSVLALEGLVFEMFAEASRARATAGNVAPRWLKRVEEYVRANFMLSFTIEDLARTAEVHPAHLSRVFRRNHRCTIGEYVRRLRVEFAAEQLITTEIPLGEIALTAGFADQSHFTNTFKSRFGFTPSAYRKLRKSSSFTKMLH
jgi:AraC family transcriptional regulator